MRELEVNIREREIKMRELGGQHEGAEGAGGQHEGASGHHLHHQQYHLLHGEGGEEVVLLPQVGWGDDMVRWVVCSDRHCVTVLSMHSLLLFSTV